MFLQGEEFIKRRSIVLKGIATTAGLVLAASFVFAEPPKGTAQPAQPAPAPAAPKKEEPKKVEPPKATEPAKVMEKDIVDTAMTAGNFTTLTASLKAAGLTDTLKGKGPFTLFAPTDEAFKKLGTEKLDALMKPESKDNLKGILNFHVVSSSMLAADVSKAKEIKTVNGQSFMVETKDGKTMIGNDPKAMATITKTDIKCSNGVIHVIDTVLMPKAAEAKKEAPKPESKKEEPKKDTGKK